MTNLVLLSWLIVVTNTESLSIPLSAIEQEQITSVVEYRTNIQVTVTSNVIGTVRSTLRFNGTNWVPAVLAPRSVILPPMPPGLGRVFGLESRVSRSGPQTPDPRPQPPLPRFGIPTMPPPLPDAAMLEQERQAREKVANEKRDPKRRS